MTPFRSTLAAAAVGLSAICAPLAHADQGTYLNALASNGFPVSSQDDTRQITQFGYAVCQALYSGESEPNAVGQIIARLGNRGADIDPQRAQVLVSAAHSQLCPDAR